MSPSEIYIKGVTKRRKSAWTGQAITSYCWKSCQIRRASKIIRENKEAWVIDYKSTKVSTRWKFWKLIIQRFVQIWETFSSNRESRGGDVFGIFVMGAWDWGYRNSKKTNKMEKESFTSRKNNRMGGRSGNWGSDL